MKYWKTYQKNLIMKILDAVKKEELEILLWQTQGENRRIYSARISGLKKSELILKFNPESINDLQYFDNSKSYYAHIKVLETLFKKENFNLIGTSLESTLPNELQIYERRKNERFTYLYQDHKNLTFKTHKAITPDSEHDYTQPSVLVDISTSGAGIVVPQEVRDKMPIGSKIYLINVTDQKLPSPFEVEIIYDEIYREEDGHKLYKIGLKFSDQLDSISYKSIRSVVEKKSKRSQGLDPSRYCGLTHEEQINKINQVELKNPQLAINLKNGIDYLDRLRYLTTQMKIELLTNIKHDLLASALRMSSKELIYDLLIEVSSNLRNEFLDKLEDERPASAISKAQDEVMKYIRDKESKGEFVLSPNSFETYV